MISSPLYREMRPLPVPRLTSRQRAALVIAGAAPLVLIGPLLGHGLAATQPVPGGPKGTFPAASPARPGDALNALVEKTMANRTLASQAAGSQTTASQAEASQASMPAPPPAPSAAVLAGAMPATLSAPILPVAMGSRRGASAPLSVVAPARMAEPAAAPANRPARVAASLPAPDPAPSTPRAAAPALPPPVAQAQPSPSPIVRIRVRSVDSKPPAQSDEQRRGSQTGRSRHGQANQDRGKRGSRGQGHGKGRD